MLSKISIEIYVSSQGHIKFICAEAKIALSQISHIYQWWPIPKTLYPPISI